MDIKQQTQNVANQGRYGDSMLMHVNPAEVQGLASMMPLTQNPQTGQPEAFLPFLAPLLGSYAGVGLLGGSLGSAAAGAIGSGLATAIAEGDLKKGIMAGITGFGLGKVLGQVGSGAPAAGEEAFADAVAKVPDANAITAQATGDAARTAAEKTAMDTFRGIVPEAPITNTIADATNIAGQAGTGALPAGLQPIVPEPTYMEGVGNRFAAMNKNLLSGDTLTALSQPSAYLPIAMGEGQRGVMEAQEQFERDMAQFELDKKRRRDQLFADNPEQIPFSSPFYGASGGIVSLAEGKSIRDALKTPVMPDAPTQSPQPIPQVDNSFEAAMAGAQDYMYMPPPEPRIRRFEDPKGTEVMVENQLTGEMEGTGQFKPPSSYRPGIDAEFNYFPLSNRPATYNQNYLQNAGYGGPLAGFINQYLYGDTTGIGQNEYNQSYNANATMSDGSPIMANVKNDFMAGVNQYLQSNPYASNPYLSGDSSLLLRDDIGAASADYLEYLKNQESREQGGGDLASGGLIGLAEGKKIPEDNKGLKALAEKSPQTVRDMGFDFQAGGMMPQPQEVEQLTMAITGSIPNGDAVIDMFIQKYGNEIFMQIRESVLNPTQQAQTQGMIKGQGGGMDDEVMGMIGNQRPVAVSPGEYIVPADVVSGIGDGSSDAGAVELDDMLDRVRQERTGTTKQAPKLANVGGIMPR
tara:strand:- start:13724 stop:15796 length:2073 start_codon:yes stop_codon:yes gene_type:complete